MGYASFVMALVLVTLMTFAITTRFSGDGVAPAPAHQVMDVSQATATGLGDVVQPTLSTFWSTFQAPMSVATDFATFGSDQLTRAPAMASPGMWLLAVGASLLAALSCWVFKYEPCSDLLRRGNRYLHRLSERLAIRRSTTMALGRIVLNTYLAKQVLVLASVLGLGVLISYATTGGLSLALLLTWGAALTMTYIELNGVGRSWTKDVGSHATRAVINSALGVYSDTHGARPYHLARLWQAISPFRELRSANDLTATGPVTLTMSTTSAQSRGSPDNFLQVTPGFDNRHLVFGLAGIT